MISPEHRAVFSADLRRRRRGRPRVARPSAVISVRVPEDLYDALCRIASLERAPLADVVRRRLASLPLCNN